MTTLQAEKVDQAIGILDELGIDAWLTFVRETTETGDPVLPLILGQPLTWQSALLLTRGGDRIAIVGRYEDEAVASTGVWTDIVTYVEGIRAPLQETLRRLDPRQLAVNYSLDDVKADGLSHGMYQLLGQHLEGTPYGKRLQSAERVITALRGRKTPTEIARIETAIATTDEIFASVAEHGRPGTTEADIAAFMHAEVDRRGLETSWERAMCPIVTTGPDSMVGHGLPSTSLSITPGRIFHLDFGVRQDEYCSDIQRAWYVPSAERPAPTDGQQRAFDTVVAAIQAAADAVRPGVEGWRVDEAARRVVIGAGFPEYQHATGHHVGRAAHDGGGVLGPRWERYGRTTSFPLEAGNVVTLELGIDNVDDGGYLGLEEMVLVTDAGARWLTAPQTELLPLPGA